MRIKADPTALVTEAVTDDDVLGAAARSLAATAIATAQDFLVNGSPQMKLKLISSLLPAIGRALAAQEVDEEMVELRAQLRGLQQAMLVDVTAEEGVVLPPKPHGSEVSE